MVQPTVDHRLFCTFKWVHVFHTSPIWPRWKKNKKKKHAYLQSLPCDRKCSPGNQKWSNLNTKLVLLLVSILLCKLGTHGHVFHHFFFSIKFLMHLLELIQLIQWMSINLPTNTMLRPVNPRANKLSPPPPQENQKKTFFFFRFFHCDCSPPQVHGKVSNTKTSIQWLLY